MSWLEQLYELAERYLGIPSERVDEVLWTIVILALFVAIRKAAVWIVSRRADDPTRQYLAVKTTTSILGLAAVLALARLWLGGLSGLAAYLGIVSAGLAIALHDPLTNLAGWIFIIIRRPFTVGDRVQVGEHAGDVIDQRFSPSRWWRSATGWMPTRAPAGSCTSPMGWSSERPSPTSPRASTSSGTRCR